MPKALRIVLAIVAGFIAGSVVNLLLINVGGSVVPPPPGANLQTAEGWQAAMPLLQPSHFLFPFLAHALGTFVGAYVTALLTPDRARGPAYFVGALFFLGGCAAAAMIPAPLWFKAADLILAYAPMTWAGHRLAARGRPASVRAS